MGELVGASTLEAAYVLLPPPLSALPAKYHAPLSLGIHSLSAGYISSRLAELAELSGYEELAFVFGLVHDIHQKLISDGLSTLKTTKKYLRRKLDELGYREYVRYVDDALEQDMCGKGRPARGLPKELAIVCHIGDMAQGRIEGYALLHWLRDRIRSVSEELTVRLYSIMIPQPFARAYAMLRIYGRYIADKEHLALASPWGLYVITYEDELPEVLEVSWDDLRIDSIIDYEEIVKTETEGKSKRLGRLQISGDEAKSRLWSRFARMFYKPDNLVKKVDGREVKDEPIYPKLAATAHGLFVNIVFTDVEFVELKPEETNLCGLCCTPHPKECSLPISMYGTQRAVKIAGVRITSEKWNRFLPAHLKVKTWDSKGPWKHGIGMCPLCTLDAVAVRELGLTAVNGFITVSIAKPIPVELVRVIGQALRDRESLTNTLPAVGISELRGVIPDYATATITTSEGVLEPRTENMFENGELVGIGKLLSFGLYPLKFLPGLDTSLPDRLLTTTVTFQALNFPVTSKGYSEVIPWVAKLVEVAGHHRRSDGMNLLMDRPHHAPLHLLSLDKPAYDYVGNLLREVGMST